MLTSMSGKTVASKPEKPEEPESEVAEPPPGAKAGGKKKLILIAAAPILLIGVLAGLWFSGVLPGLLGMRHNDQTAQEAARPAIPVFVDLPDLIANLSSPAGKPAYVKLQVRLE